MRNIKVESRLSFFYTLYLIPNSNDKPNQNDLKMAKIEEEKKFNIKNANECGNW